MAFAKPPYGARYFWSLAWTGCAMRRILSCSSGERGWNSAPHRGAQSAPARQRPDLALEHRLPDGLDLLVLRRRESLMARRRPLPAPAAQHLPGPVAAALVAHQDQDADLCRPARCMARQRGACSWSQAR